MMQSQICTSGRLYVYSDHKRGTKILSGLPPRDHSLVAVTHQKSLTRRCNAILTVPHSKSMFGRTMYATAALIGKFLMKSGPWPHKVKLKRNKCIHAVCGTILLKYRHPSIVSVAHTGDISPVATAMTNLGRLACYQVLWYTYGGIKTTWLCFTALSSGQRASKPRMRPAQTQPIGS